MPVAAMRQLGPVERNQRGRERLKFKDAANADCAIGATYDGSHLWIGNAGSRIACLTPEQVEALVTHLESWLNRGSLRFTFEREEGE